MSKTQNIGQWMMLSIFTAATIFMVDLAFTPAPSLFAG